MVTVVETQLTDAHSRQNFSVGARLGAAVGAGLGAGVAVGESVGAGNSQSFSNQKRESSELPVAMTS